MKAPGIAMENHSETSDSPAEEKVKWAVHIEVRLQQRVTMRFDTIRKIVESYLHSSFDRISLPSVLEGWDEIPELASTVEKISASESSCPQRSPPLDETLLEIHVYQPSDSESFEDFNAGGDDADDTNAATVCDLPNRHWEGLWDSLIYADDIKMRLLDYIHATLLLSDAEVDLNLISWNRVVLLHGPPGTGKTSLCRALAQKLSIRLSHRYSQARLLEINSHSLFSKWFSESGKLVQRLFNNITELVDEDDSFLVVLIDEVESLTAARAGAMAGTEPSDGLRVVNALLTQLDKLKHRKNVLIMSTSNLVQAIDSAFVDRADIVQYIDLPPREAVYDIMRTSLCEMVDKGIVLPIAVPTLNEAKMLELSAGASTAVSHTDPRQREKTVGLKLLALATICKQQNLSGRALRRLPVLALARYISTGSISAPGGKRRGVAVEVWLEGMEKVVREQEKELQRLS
ncbi:P-loop containing nucleoside triphosphate hydrolase protein [Schizophyllum amplum]|uniref:P-loop containing nucleoside triphosphate hydrolase protein n=1 Tax=Schizophyllum amplum TaxID=97359 RepID=A0A550CU41_9AGAR|nr:P-loop containing nucleoside triphosphate hydrolase protein [Auriculariopsis ampla]